jgi:hypothetical protein
VGGALSVSIETATSGRARKAPNRRAGAGTWGAWMNVGMTSSPSVHWNQVGTIRGVPSWAVQATRAGMAEASNLLASGGVEELRAALRYGGEISVSHVCIS